MNVTEDNEKMLDQSGQLEDAAAVLKASVAVVSSNAGLGMICDTPGHSELGRLPSQPAVSDVQFSLSSCLFRLI